MSAAPKDQMQVACLCSERTRGCGTARSLPFLHHLWAILLQRMQRVQGTEHDVAPWEAAAQDVSTQAATREDVAPQAAAS